MRVGHVERLQALFPVTLKRQNTPDLTIEFVVDTGFAGYLTLPPAAVVALHLPFDQNISATLAGGSLVVLAAHDAVIAWNKEERIVRVLATGDRPLLGTALLDGSELVVQFTENGLVTVGEL